MASAAKALDAKIADDPYYPLYNRMVSVLWQDGNGDSKSTRETLESALKLDINKRLVGIAYSGQTWSLLSSGDLKNVSEENRVILTHRDVNNVYVACGGTLESSDK